MSQQDPYKEFFDYANDFWSSKPETVEFKRSGRHFVTIKRKLKPWIVSIFLEFPYQNSSSVMMSFEERGFPAVFGISSHYSFGSKKFLSIKEEINEELYRMCMSYQHIIKETESKLSSLSKLVNQ